MASNVHWTSETSSWMGSINDKLNVGQLSIPGTHASAAFYCGDAYKCQIWPIDRQLNEGIRFLDIHVRKYGNALCVYQWSAYQSIELYGVLCSVLDFLNANPTECVLIRIWEDKIRMSDPGIWNLVRDDVNRFGAEKFWLKNEVPSLGEVRGRVVFLKNFNGSEMGIEHNLLQELEEASVPTMFSLQSAWKNIEQKLQETEENKLRLLYCVGASWGAYPCHVASYFNAWLLNFFQNPKCLSCASGISAQGNLSNHKTKTIPCSHIYGIIAMDFPDHYLIEKIIECNF